MSNFPRDPKQPPRLMTGRDRAAPPKGKRLKPSFGTPKPGQRLRPAPDQDRSEISEAFRERMTAPMQFVSRAKDKAAPDSPAPDQGYGTAPRKQRTQGRGDTPEQR